jgi:hypothetical protein
MSNEQTFIINQARAMFEKAYKATLSQAIKKGITQAKKKK